MSRGRRDLLMFALCIFVSSTVAVAGAIWNWSDQTTGAVALATLPFVITVAAMTFPTSQR